MTRRMVDCGVLRLQPLKPQVSSPTYVHCPNHFVLCMAPGMLALEALPGPPEPWVGTGEGPRCPEVTSAWPRAERLIICIITSLFPCSVESPEKWGEEHEPEHGTPRNYTLIEDPSNF